MSSEPLIRGLRAELTDAGLQGSFLVRDLHTGAEIGIEPDVEFPVASLVKVPLALATIERIAWGELDAAEQVEVRPSDGPGAGPVGLGKFRHPARVAVDDLLYLSVCISDNAAADTLFGFTPPEKVAARLQELGLRGHAVRHRLRDLNRTLVEKLGPADAHFAHTLAIGAGTAGRGHRVPQLDVTRANSGTARAYADLLQAIWTPSVIDPGVAARLRGLMGDNLLRQRLSPDFASDSAVWSSKTGTLLNLRHEAGVVEHEDGQAFAVVALTESNVPAITQPGAEALMGRVARMLRDHLRGMGR